MIYALKCAFIDPPGHGRIGGHYSVRPKNKNTLQR